MSIASQEKVIKKIETQKKETGRVVKTDIVNNQVVITGSADLLNTQTPNQVKEKVQPEIKISEIIPKEEVTSKKLIGKDWFYQ